MIVENDETYDVQDLPPETRRTEDGRQDKTRSLKDITRESAAIAEKSAILDALAKTGWNVTQAARFLGVSRATLQTKMKKYDLRGSKK